MKINHLFAFGLCICLWTCQDWNYERVSFPEVVTGEATEVTANTAALSGIIDGLREGETVGQHGHVWSLETDEPSLEDNNGRTSKGREGNRSFSSEADGLRANTLYRYRAYAMIDEEVIYGEVNTFQTDNFLVFVENISVDEDQAVIDWKIDGYIGTPDRLGLVFSDVDERPGLDSENVILIEQSSPFLNCTPPCPIRDTLPSLVVNANYYLRAFVVPGPGEPAVYSDSTYFHTFPGSVGWRRKSDFPGTIRIDYYGASTGDRGYIGQGADPTELTMENWEYAPATDSWERKMQTPSFFLDPFEVSVVSPFDAHFSIKDKLYFGPGHPSYPGRPAILEFDPATNIWQEGLNSEMIPGRLGEAVSTFTIHEVGYALLPGEDDQGELWSFRPAPSSYFFQKIFSFTEPSLGRPPGFDFPDPDINVGLVIDDKAYLLLPNGCWEFDLQNPQQPKIRELDPFPEYYPGAAFAVGDRIYAGYAFKTADKSLLTNHFWALDPKRPAGEQWQRMPDFPGLRVQAYVGFSASGAGYLMHGKNRNVVGDVIFTDKRVWEFMPPE